MADLRPKMIITQKCSVNKSAKQLLKWSKYMYYSDRLLEIKKIVFLESVYSFSIYKILSFLSILS